MIAGPDLTRGSFSGVLGDPFARRLVGSVCLWTAGRTRSGSGEKPQPTACPHAFSTGKSLRPVNFSVENPNQDVTKFF
jgi:hypothetical protein